MSLHVGGPPSDDVDRDPDPDPDPSPPSSVLLLLLSLPDPESPSDPSFPNMVSTVAGRKSAGFSHNSAGVPVLE